MKRVVPLLVIFISFQSIGQDSHYWSQHFGPRSVLLGGAVVAGVRDNSGIYYNPGVIGFISNKNISVSATGYEYDQIKIENGAGIGLDIKSRTLQAIPLIISGVFKHAKYPQHTLGYCLLTNDQFNIRASARHEAILNVLNDNASPGLEEYIGQYTFKSSVYEMISGWAYGYKVSDILAIGFGNYGCYRSLRADTYIATRALPIDSVNQFNLKISSFDENKSIEIKNIRTYFKAGVALDLEKLKLGLTITSPSINVFGWATIAEDLTVSNINIPGTGTYLNFLATDKQEGLKTIYRTPLSIAFGAQYTWHKTVFVFATQWYDKVNSYNIVTPDEKQIVRPTGLYQISSTQVLRVEENKRSVINFAVGFEQMVSARLQLSGSFRTNQASIVRDKLSDVRVTFTDWNINHCVIGITRKNEKSDVSLGLSYAFGKSKNTNQWVNITEPVETRLLTGELKKTNVNYQSVSLVIGYTYYFK